MAKGRAPANCYWRGNQLWGKVRIKGVVHRFALRTGDPAVASARVRTFKSRQIAIAHYGDERKTWADAVEKWGEHIEHQVGPETYKRYVVSIAQINPFLEGYYVDEIDKAKVAEIVAKRRAAPVTVATIRRDLVALSSVLGFCEDAGYVESNPALGRLRRLRERREPILLPDGPSIERVVRLCPGTLSSLVASARRTGARQAELSTAQRSRLDHARRQLTIIGKGNKLRTINLPDDAYEIVRQVPARLGCKWLFWHGEGEPYRNVSSRFRAIVVRAQKEAQSKGEEFTPFRFHDLRHYFAVEKLKEGWSLYDLQQHLGHSSVKVTEMYLRYLTPEEKRIALQGRAQNAAHMQRSESA